MIMKGKEQILGLVCQCGYMEPAGLIADLWLSNGLLVFGYIHEPVDSNVFACTLQVVSNFKKIMWSAAVTIKAYLQWRTGDCWVMYINWLPLSDEDYALYKSRLSSIWWGPWFNGGFSRKQKLELQSRSDVPD